MTGLLVVLVLLGAMLHALPGWTRPDVFFAVTIDPAFRKSGAARAILVRYRMILWAGTAVAVGLGFALGLLAALLAQFAGFGLALAGAHHQALAYRAPAGTVVEVDLAAPKETLPGGPLFALAPLAALVLLALWVRRHWERLPARIPVHWGFHGADRWVATTTEGVYGFIAIHFGLCLFFALAAWGILQRSPRLSGGQAAALRDRRFRRLNLKALLAISYFLAAEAWVAFLKPDIIGVWWVLALGLFLAVYLARLIPLNRQPVAAPPGDRTPDDCWKMGILYYNPADPSIFVAKRFGVGYTLNFGNRWSWTALGGLIFVVVAAKLLR